MITQKRFEKMCGTIATYGRHGDTLAVCEKYGLSQPTVSAAKKVSGIDELNAPRKIKAFQGLYERAVFNKRYISNCLEDIMKQCNE